MPPLNATGDLADEAFARECQLELVKGGLAHPAKRVCFKTASPSRVPS